MFLFIHSKVASAVGGFFKRGLGIGVQPASGGQVFNSFPDQRNVGGVISHGGSSCDPPWSVSSATGRCTLSQASVFDRGGGFGPQRPTAGFRGALQRALPGGASGFEDEFGMAVMGAFGLPALEPAIVGQVQRRDGSMALIRRCPRGMVLATDDLCYSKGTRGLASFRKWKPEAGGFLPRRDVKCLRRAIAIKGNKTTKKMLRELGLG